MSTTPLDRLTPRIRLAWARTGPSHKSVAAPIDHGTRDSRRTLCGIEVGGVDDSAAFDPDRRLFLQAVREGDEE